VTELEDLAQRLRAWRSALDTETGAARVVLTRGQELAQRQCELAELREQLDRVAGVLTRIGAERDATMRNQIEALVSAGLQAIFTEKLTFHLVESISRGTSQIDFCVKTHLADGSSYTTDVLSARGGGLAATVGLLLRVVVLLLSRQTYPESTPDILVLDETLAMLSSDRLEAAGVFLRSLVENTGLQIILVTHQEELAEAADITYRLSLVDGITRVKKEA
jgi:DNA repair exonuclease SbcCD ATPase subunit